MAHCFSSEGNCLLIFRSQIYISCVQDAHLPAKTCEAPRCVCSLYTPAHNMNCLQLLTPTLNAAYCHCSCQQSHLQNCSVTLHSGTNIHTGRLILRTYKHGIYAYILPKLVVILRPRPTNIFHNSRLSAGGIYTATTTITTTTTI